MSQWKTNLQNARPAFRRLWVAGTIGAFFMFLVRAVAERVQVSTLSCTPDWEYTFDTLMPYAYLLWLLIYFFTFNVTIETSERELQPGEALFDVLQSVVAFVVAGFFGFLTKEPFVQHQGTPFFWANAAIAFIALGSLIFSRLFTWQDNGRQITAIRLAGAVLALAAMLVACRLSHHALADIPDGTRWCLATILVLHFLLLCWYFLVRVIGTKQGRMR